MTRDEKHAADIRGASTEVAALLHAAEQYEQDADRRGAELHAVLYGKVADALNDARHALDEAADLMDPQTTDVAHTDA